MSESSRVGDGMRRRLRDVARRLMLNVHDELLRTTPVDTGFAVTNWVPQTGGAFEGTAGTYQEAVDGQLTTGPQQAGVQAIKVYELEQGDIHDTNNVDYIQKLNDGSSAQAPAAFVQAAIVKGIERTGARGIEARET